MNIKIEVKLESGATVVLTEAQLKQVVTYIEELIHVKPTRKYTKRTVNKHKRWTLAEEEEIKEITLNTKRGERSRAYRHLAVKFGRTKHAVQLRASVLGGKQKPMFTTTDSTFNNDITHIS